MHNNSKGVRVCMASETIEASVLPNLKGPPSRSLSHSTCHLLLYVASANKEVQPLMDAGGVVMHLFLGSVWESNISCLSHLSIPTTILLQLP